MVPWLHLGNTDMAGQTLGQIPNARLLRYYTQALAHHCYCRPYNNGTMPERRAATGRGTGFKSRGNYGSLRFRIFPTTMCIPLADEGRGCWYIWLIGLVVVCFGGGGGGGWWLVGGTLVGGLIDGCFVGENFSLHFLTIHAFHVSSVALSLCSTFSFSFSSPSSLL